RRPPAIGLAPPAAAPPQRVERAVARDRQDPRREWTTARLVLVDARPHLHEHVPQHLLRLGLVPEDARGEAEHPGPEGVIQLGQGALFARFEAPNEGALVLLTKTFWLGHLDSDSSVAPGGRPPGSSHFSRFRHGFNTLCTLARCLRALRHDDRRPGRPRPHGCGGWQFPSW